MNPRNKGKAHLNGHPHRNAKLTLAPLREGDDDRTCLYCFKAHRRRSPVCGPACGKALLEREARPSLSVWADPARAVPAPPPKECESFMSAFGWVEDWYETNHVERKAVAV